MQIFQCIWNFGSGWEEAQGNKHGFIVYGETANEQNISLMGESLREKQRVRESLENGDTVSGHVTQPPGSLPWQLAQENIRNFREFHSQVLNGWLMQVLHRLTWTFSWSMSRRMYGGTMHVRRSRHRNWLVTLHNSSCQQHWETHTIKNGSFIDE